MLRQFATLLLWLNLLIAVVCSHETHDYVRLWFFLLCIRLSWLYTRDGDNSAAAEAAAVVIMVLMVLMVLLLLVMMVIMVLVVLVLVVLVLVVLVLVLINGIHAGILCQGRTTSSQLQPRMLLVHLRP